MNMASVVTIILAGGQGKRLYPLTQKRSKPAVPIAGRFRLIDIPISNCIHSGLRKIFILTQYSSESIHRHIFLTYRFDSFTKDFVTILSAQQTLESPDWYQGTADAVRKNIRFVRMEGNLVLVLSGDHLYRMDYRKFIDFHLEKKADISIAVYPVYPNQAPELGVMKVDDHGQIVAFLEKPKDPAQIENMKAPENIFQQFSIDPAGRTHLASMGVYLFNWDVLKELLENNDYRDFGKEVIPASIMQKDVYGYFFDGYWEDIGTIRSFFNVHMDLTQPLPQFNFYDEQKPIFSRARFLPGSKILSSEVQNSILCEGSIINSSKIVHSIIGIRSRIGNNAAIERSVLMGADFFESKEEIEGNLQKKIPRIGIGNDCVIRNAIIDKNARIGNGVKLVNEKGIDEDTQKEYVIRDGIIVVPKNTIIPDGTVI
ncbi:MAG TPA: glucose-1-phosphate adenylyltransferase [Candidatus Heimdallarchaeota archaeon]|nr:glucose-1-phosphate adenylyltransferase [Candidatus Heimdallarchaeota archaeon]